MTIKYIIFRIGQKITMSCKILWLRVCPKYTIAITPIPGISDCFAAENYDDFAIKIFGEEVDSLTINWHKDYKSGYVYPRKNFNNININFLFNKGVEVKFPWDLSRFQYGIDLAINYHSCKNEEYYALFKKLILDWIENNPFMVGVNWVCTMDVAIRATNWVVVANMFGDIFWRDKDFVALISNSLIKQAYYIEAFPEIQSKSNNHLISDYSGLFILALSLKKHPYADRWMGMAIKGLESCMKEQVFEDGTDFENSIPYHRLTVELFAVPLILKESAFSDFYKQRLFRMFEFVAAYIDHQGNAPQIGDNDSGIFIKLSKSEEYNHSYLLSLGEAIYEHSFGWDRDTAYIPFLANLKSKIRIDKVRDCRKSICFENSGYYFLKNENIAISLFCPQTNAGHRHFDTGSFTLSYKGNPIVVDPGSGCYTSNWEVRKILRDYPSHNLYYTKRENKYNVGYFGAKVDTYAQVLEFTDNSLIYTVEFDTGTKIKRHFYLLSNMLIVEDEIDGKSEDLMGVIHFYNTIEVQIDGAVNISEEEYQYSSIYSVLETRKKIVISPSNHITTKIICK